MLTKAIACATACFLVLLCVGLLLHRIHQLEEQLEKERFRVYKLADGIELLQSISRSDCVFDLNMLPESRLIHAEEVKRPEATSILPSGAKLFLYSLRMDMKIREEYDRKYRDESVLSYGTYIVVDNHGRVVSMGWSKP